MHIDSYRFGKIVINGTTYTKDVLILPDKVLSPWWRIEGHSLAIDDLAEVISATPEVLVIGTGAMGVMGVPEETLEYLRDKGVEVIIKRTGAAASEFNRLSATGNVAAAFHLTC
ncbi:MAG: hypothetical protein KAR83_02010 [Thermodesulfovibrionales bacterium]|nr:hypothetical protein [Thermodesulfovibrionales bacterium]